MCARREVLVVNSRDLFDLIWRRGQQVDYGQRRNEFSDTDTDTADPRRRLRLAVVRLCDYPYTAVDGCSTTIRRTIRALDGGI